MLDRTFIERLAILFEVIWYPLYLHKKIRFLLSIGDRVDEPFVGVAMSTNSKAAVLIPDVFFLRTRGYQAERNAIDSFLANQGATAKKPIAYWRGSLTGHRPWVNERWTNQRILLCAFAKSNESKFDCKITDWVVSQEESSFIDFIARSGIFLKGRRPFLESLDFALQIDCDGMGNAWNGLFLKMYSGAPVLKIRSTSGLQQWYYDRLTNMRNIVYVSSDLSNMTEQYDFLIADSGLMRSIGDEGRKLASELKYAEEVALAQVALNVFAH